MVFSSPNCSSSVRFCAGDRTEKGRMSSPLLSKIQFWPSMDLEIKWSLVYVRNILKTVIWTSFIMKTADFLVSQSRSTQHWLHSADSYREQRKWSLDLWITDEETSSIFSNAPFFRNPNTVVQRWYWLIFCKIWKFMKKRNIIK